MEIERKFLVNKAMWEQLARFDADSIRQGYIADNNGTSIRVRTTNTKAWLNIKKLVSPTERFEFEYAIPLEDAMDMFTHLVQNELSKTRYRIEHAGNLWEVDVFEGKNEGLIVAEIELPDADTAFEKPAWIAGEVTHDFRYLNTNLATQPYTTW